MSWACFVIGVYLYRIDPAISVGKLTALGVPARVIDSTILGITMSWGRRPVPDTRAITDPFPERRWTSPTTVDNIQLGMIPGELLAREDWTAQDGSLLVCRADISLPLMSITPTSSPSNTLPPQKQGKFCTHDSEWLLLYVR